jgi:hypothetical protein
VLLFFLHHERALHLPNLLSHPHDWEHHFQLLLLLLLAWEFLLPPVRLLHLPNLSFLPHGWEHHFQLLLLLLLN